MSCYHNTYSRALAFLLSGGDLPAWIQNADLDQFIDKLQGIRPDLVERDIETFAEPGYDVVNTEPAIAHLPDSGGRLIEDMRRLSVIS